MPQCPIMEGGHFAEQIWNPRHGEKLVWCFAFKIYLKKNSKSKKTHCKNNHCNNIFDPHLLTAKLIVSKDENILNLFGLNTGCPRKNGALRFLYTQKRIRVYIDQWPIQYHFFGNFVNWAPIRANFLLKKPVVRHFKTYFSLQNSCAI